MTAKGERPMMPTYGSDLRELLFEPNMDDHIDDLFEDSVKEATAVWMPEAMILYVRVERDLINTPSYDQVYRPIYSESAYRWKKYEDKIKPILPILKPWINKFNY